MRHVEMVHYESDMGGYIVFRLRIPRGLSCCNLGEHNAEMTGPKVRSVLGKAPSRIVDPRYSCHSFG